MATFHQVLGACCAAVILIFPTSPALADQTLDVASWRIGQKSLLAAKGEGELVPQQPSLTDQDINEVVQRRDEERARFRTRAVIAAGTLGVATYGANAWWHSGLIGDFGFTNEGWFGQNTYARRRAGETKGKGDYDGHTYLLAAKASGVPALRDASWLRYLELTVVGYGTVGYEGTQAGSRFLYYGVSLNLAEILANTVFRTPPHPPKKDESRVRRMMETAHELLQVPGTALTAAGGLSFLGCSPAGMSRGQCGYKSICCRQRGDRVFTRPPSPPTNSFLPPPSPRA